MGNLAKEYWTVLTKLMQHVEYCFEALANHQVISHMYHAKQVVPFKIINRTIGKFALGEIFC